MGQGTDISPDFGLLPASLWVEINKKQCSQRSLIRPATLVGRAPGADVQLRHPDVSNVHCVIVNNGETLIVRDLESREGTRLNRQSVTAATLISKDVLKIGPFRLQVRIAEEAESSVTATDGGEGGMMPEPLEASAVPISTQEHRSPQPLDRPATLIGSARTADICLKHKRVSKGHAIIVNDGRALRVRDLSSRDGITVNGRYVDVAHLQDGDLLRIGPYRLRIAIGGEQSVQVDDEDQPPLTVERDALLREVKHNQQELAVLSSKMAKMETEWALESERLASNRDAKAPQLDAESPGVG